jgi:DNA-binding response OmpR family regulator
LGQILLIEDDQSLGISLGISLRTADHTVDWVTSVSHARASVERNVPDLIILDLGLPDGDGLDFCASIRARGQTVPVIILTARTSLESRLMGLELGADDYVCKPFDVPELLARVDAQLRRRTWEGPGERLHVGRLEIDLARKEAWVDGASKDLTELEWRLLSYLLEQNERPVSRGQLLTRVWGIDAEVQTRTVDTFISRLRKLIEEEPRSPKHLLSVRGLGYRLKI